VGGWPAAPLKGTPVEGNDKGVELVSASSV